MFGNEEAERTAICLINFQLASNANAPPSMSCISLVGATPLGDASASRDAFPIAHCVPGSSRTA